MSILTKIVLGVLGVAVIFFAAIASFMMYMTTAEPAVPTNTPTTVPSTPTVTPINDEEANPFDPAVVNPFEDEAATNPFATPTPETNYTNPFTDL